MQRPVSVIVLGILNIVFAVLGLLGTIVTFAMMSMADVKNDPVMQMMRKRPGAHRLDEAVDSAGAAGVCRTVSCRDRTVAIQAVGPQALDRLRDLRHHHDRGRNGHQL